MDNLSNRLDELVKEIREIEQQYGIKFYMKYDPQKEFDITLKVEKLINKQFLVCSDSREIAKNLGIRHAELLRKFTDNEEYFNIITERKFASSEITSFFNVIEDSYTDTSGKSNKCLKLDQSATELLISMFNNKAAIKCKMAYIAQFHSMANFIKDTGQTEDFRNYVKSQYKTHTDVLKEELNLTPKDKQEYINYARLINKKLLGIDKGSFCKEHGIALKDFRSSLNDTMNKQLLELEKRVDAWVIAYSDEGLDNSEIYHKVKERIENYNFKN